MKKLFLVLSLLICTFNISAQTESEQKTSLRYGIKDISLGMTHLEVFKKLHPSLNSNDISATISRSCVRRQGRPIVDCDSGFNDYEEIGILFEQPEELQFTFNTKNNQLVRITLIFKLPKFDNLKNFSNKLVSSYSNKFQVEPTKKSKIISKGFNVEYKSEEKELIQRCIFAVAPKLMNIDRKIDPDFYYKNFKLDTPFQRYPLTSTFRDANALCEEYVVKNKSVTFNMPIEIISAYNNLNSLKKNAPTQIYSSINPPKIDKNCKNCNFEIVAYIWNNQNNSDSSELALIRNTYTDTVSQVNFLITDMNQYEELMKQ